MRGLLALVILLGACAPLRPPEIYDHPPRGKVDIQRLSRDEANRICQAHVISRTGSVAGCSYRARDVCVVVINVDSLYDKEAVLRHELAHCNGWTH